MIKFIWIFISVLLAQTDPDLSPTQASGGNSEETLVSNQFVWDVTDERDPFRPYRSPRALK
jgi:hypothetical protein